MNVENILDEVHSSSFENSDENPVEFLDAEKMVVTCTTTRNAYTSGTKFESSQKMSITPTSKDIVGSSARLLNNLVSTRFYQHYKHNEEQFWKIQQNYTLSILTLIPFPPLMLGLCHVATLLHVQDR